MSRARRALEELARNPPDLGIPAEQCKIVVYTDRGAAFRPCESGIESVRVTGCASGRVELDKSHPEHICGVRLTNNVGELQAMGCAVLWLAEQIQIGGSMLMRMETAVLEY